jgi:hypothetical protein
MGIERSDVFGFWVAAQTLKKLNARHTSLVSVLKGHGGRRAPAMRRLP